MSLMAYSTGTVPIPPPPTSSGAFSHAYNLANSATNRTAQQGISPVNQMNSGFGGRQAGNPGISTMPSISGGNRTSQHVATPGNNNVSYGSPNLISSAQSLWQQARQPGGVAPINGMSLGFMKNTQARNPPIGSTGTPAPVAPPPPSSAVPVYDQGSGYGVAPVAGDGRTNPLTSTEANVLPKPPAGSGLGTVAPGTPAPTAVPGTVAPIGPAPTTGSAAPAKQVMTISAAQTAFKSAYPGVALTYTAPDGSVRRTSQWQNYLNTITVK